MDNIAVKYAQLATVAVRQPFYVDGVARKSDAEPDLDFEFHPTAECTETMERLDILFRRAERLGGLALAARVLGKSAGGDDLVRFLPAPADKLTFWMRLRNPNVLNFDDLPTELDPARIYYFANQQTDAAAPRDDLHLTKSAAGVDGAHDRIVRSRENYRFHHSAEIASAAATVTNLLTGSEVLPTSVVNKGGQSDVAFDLRSLPLGRCELRIADAVKDEFYFAGSSEPQEFGLIELVLGSTLAANYRILEPDRSLTSARPAYTIRLPNRHTRWRYTFQLSPSGPLATEIGALSDAAKADFLDHLNITTNDPAITFSRTATSDREVVFVSDIEIAQSERYILSSHKPLALTLKKHVGNNDEGIVRSDLPYPPISLIDARAAPPVFSDTFLTI
jgi:hypothetical protein